MQKKKISPIILCLGIGLAVAAPIGAFATGWHVDSSSETGTVRHITPGGGGSRPIVTNPNNPDETFPVPPGWPQGVPVPTNGPTMLPSRPDLPSQAPQPGRPTHDGPTILPRPTRPGGGSVTAAPSRPVQTPPGWPQGVPVPTNGPTMLPPSRTVQP